MARKINKSFNGTHQSAYDGAIVFRMFDGDKKGMLEWHEAYKSVLLRSGSMRPASKEDYLIAREYKKGALISDLMQKYHSTKYKIEAAIHRVGRDLINKSKDV